LSRQVRTFFPASHQPSATSQSGNAAADRGGDDLRQIETRMLIIAYRISAFLLKSASHVIAAAVVDQQIRPFSESRRPAYRRGSQQISIIGNWRCDQPASLSSRQLSPPHSVCASIPKYQVS
jgi:hypothetical protein